MRYIAQVFHKLVGVGWEAFQLWGYEETLGLGSPH